MSHARASKNTGWCVVIAEHGTCCRLLHCAAVPFSKQAKHQPLWLMSRRVVRGCSALAGQHPLQATATATPQARRCRPSQLKAATQLVLAQQPNQTLTRTRAVPGHTAPAARRRPRTSARATRRARRRRRPRWAPRSGSPSRSSSSRARSPGARTGSGRGWWRRTPTTARLRRCGLDYRALGF